MRKPAFSAKRSILGIPLLRTGKYSEATNPKRRPQIGPIRREDNTLAAREDEKANRINTFLKEYKSGLCASFFLFAHIMRPWLNQFRQELVDKLFKNVLQNEQNKLHELLPARNTCTFNLRNMRKFKPAFKTNRFRSSFS